MFNHFVFIHKDAWVVDSLLIKTQKRSQFATCPGMTIGWSNTLPSNGNTPPSTISIPLSTFHFSSSLQSTSASLFGSIITQSDPFQMTHLISCSSFTSAGMQSAMVASSLRLPTLVPNVCTKLTALSWHCCTKHLTWLTFIPKMTGDWSVFLILGQTKQEQPQFGYCLSPPQGILSLIPHNHYQAMLCRGVH